MALRCQVAGLPRKRSRDQRPSLPRSALIVSGIFSCALLLQTRAWWWPSTNNANVHHMRPGRDDARVVNEPLGLLVAVPFTDANIHALHTSLRRWQDVGHACSAGPKKRGVLAPPRPALWFYYAKSRAELEASDTFASVLQSLRRLLALDRCFSDVRVAYANLPRHAPDTHPAATSLMFRNLMLGTDRERLDTDGTTSSDTLSAFHSVFWMEPGAVVPIQPYWLDRLESESASDSNFWVKGCISRLGTIAKTDLPARHSPWWHRWFGHINSNALYRLNSPEFVRFLQIVFDAEPPESSPGSFDISIWSVLHDHAYLWHAYQRISWRFMYADFIEHQPDKQTADDSEGSRQAGRAATHSPKAVLVARTDGSAASGLTHAQQGQDEESPGWRGDERVSVLIRSDWDEVEYAILAVTSVAHHLPNVLEIVLVVPADDEELVSARIRHHRAGWRSGGGGGGGGLGTSPSLQSENVVQTKLKVVVEKPMQQAIDPAMQEAYTRAMADAYYCRGSHILQMQADWVLMRPVRRKDLFFGGGPILQYDRFVNLPSVAARWQAGTEAALGHRVEIYVPASASIFPRKVYALTRGWIEQVHARSFDAFFATQRRPIACLQGVDVDNNHCQQMNASAPYERGFELSTVVGAFMWAHMRASAAWVPHDQAEFAHATFVPTVPEIGCRGNAWLARKIGKTSEDLAALQHAIASGTCEEAAALRRPWARKIVQILDNA